MKVILLQDIKGVGRKYEVKDVSDGHARNFLIPRKMVEYASPSAIKKAESFKKSIDAEREVRENLAKKSAEMLKDIKITITKKANDKGHLFEQVHAEEITEALKDQAHIDLSPEYLIIEKPIKSIGEHEIRIEVGENQEKFTLHLLPS